MYAHVINAILNDFLFEYTHTRLPYKLHKTEIK